MTPDDIAAWRFDIDTGTLTKPGAHALCDALEAAWAERDRYKLYNDEFVAMRKELRERGERAEAGWALAATGLEQREAALARVRELCDGRPAHDYLEVARIRAAIEGDDQ